MRTFLALIVIGCIGYGVYQYMQDPQEEARFVKEVTAVATDKSAPAAWTPPAVIPKQPNWTWTTTDGKVYHNVKIVRIDAACVTILHSEGGGRVPINTLPPDMQKYFNYDPAAAAAVDKQFSEGVAQEKQVEAAEQPVSHTENYYSTTDDYSSAVSEAKASKKLLLLHFTGSDWCPWCKALDQQVLSTQSYQTFSASHFVTVTLDYPRTFKLAQNVEEQNNGLRQKYGVSSYPTLLVTDADGHELGRIAGMIEGGPQNTIDALQAFVPKGGLATR